MIVSIAVQKQLQVILQLIEQTCQILVWRRQTADIHSPRDCGVQKPPTAGDGGSLPVASFLLLLQSLRKSFRWLPTFLT